MSGAGPNPCRYSLRHQPHGLRIYLDAVQEAFGMGGVDYAQLVKIYGAAPGKGDERRYSPAECVGAKKKMVIDGDPHHYGE